MKRRILSLLLLFVLVSGAFGQARAFLPDLSDWARPELEQARDEGILPESLLGTSMIQPITRLEFCQGLVLTYEARFGAAPAGDAAFSDTIDASVLSAAGLGLVRGYSDGTFRPFQSISREELMVMLCRLVRLWDPSFSGGSAALSAFSDQGKISSWARSDVAALVDAGLAKGTGGGRLNPLGTTTRQEAMALLVRLLHSEAYGGQPSQEEEPLDPGLSGFLANPQLTTHGYSDSYNAAKHQFIFGSLEISRYDAGAVTLETVTVPVWKLNASTGKKTASTATFQINARLAPVVQAIFQEIFDGEEQFPLNYVGGYRPSNTTSEHNTGLAIDLNPGSNPETSKDQDPYAQGWRPGEDPYSIPADGDVVRAFHKYGFFWAGEGWSRKYDFMHFSFFGT